MAKKKKSPQIVRRYKAGITFICPVRGEITEITEVKVYSTENLDDMETVSLEEITSS